MTNQVNQAFEKWFDDRFKDLKPSEYKSNSFEIGKSNMRYGWQATTKASESEINALKERVEELQADNNQLRDELETTLTSLEESKEKECRCDYTR